MLELIFYLAAIVIILTVLFYASMFFYCWNSIWILGPVYYNGTGCLVDLAGGNADRTCLHSKKCHKKQLKFFMEKEENHSEL